MADTKQTSGLFNLNWADFGKGLLVAALTTPISVILSSLQAGSFEIDWKQTGIIALAGALAYIVKNFFTPAKDVTKVDEKP